MRSRNMRQTVFPLFCLTALLAVVLAQTPVIGGVCKLGTADVQIGGKQTQFFLKCEPTSDSQNGEGVWVVKSRNAAAAPTAPVENTQQNLSPGRKHANPNICEQDNGARENDACTVSATCLQANNGNPVTYLQCDQTNMRWMRKSCQDTFIFNFEQQTCIVPKRHPGTQHHLCPDGTPSRFKCPCPAGHTCFRQGFCCPNHITCMQTCSNTKQCSKGMICSKTTSCCQPQAHLARSDTTEIFMGDSSIFDMGGQKVAKIPPQPPNGFKVMSGLPSSSNSFDLANEHSWSMPSRGRDEAVEALPPEISPPAEQPPVAATFHGFPTDTETTSETRPPTKPSVATTSTESPMMACRGTNAVCDYDGDCPNSFMCEDNCCRLQTCPNTMKVQFTCTSNYQCGSGESCLFGGCCLRRPLTSTSTTTTTLMPTRMLRTETTPTTATMASLAIVESEPEFASNQDVDPYSEMLATEKPTTSTRMTSMMPSFGPKDVCEIDNRVSNCNMASPCPDTSECLFGSCCRVTPRTCSNGLPALTVPDICSEADECPISSVCEQGRCCPLDHAAEDLPLPKSFSQINSLKSVELAKKKKNTCLTSQTCSSIILCPPDYTCSSSGECCQLNVTCPDGTVPETVCGKDQICPSSVHSCMQMGTESVCCPNSDKGQQSNSGLVCTFSSCSNNNPCSSGTCNNGYCCSTGGAQAPIIENTVNITTIESTSNTTSPLTTTPQAETNTTQEVLSGQEDWPVGPPGYGFPENLADLDSVLVPAQGDGNSCSGGYKSNLACSLGGECPPGLFCDRLMDRCCPMVLPLTDTRNPTKVQPSRRPPNEHEQDESIEEEYRDRKRSYRSYGSRGAPCCPFQANPGCNGCQPQAAPMMAISTCPGGAYPIGNCNSGYCSPGYQCVSNSCCPQYGPPQQQIRVFSCPTGGNAVGACISGSCATGYSCVQGNCCPARETKNPFVCPDGAQAVGGCVNGQCGAGYRCSNGLCCSGTSTTVKCLDGSEAVGACIPSCQGDACGRTTVSYYCGSGYTCTTGNICCPVNSCPDGGDPLGPTINGLCPTGYVAQGSICCSASLCADGSASSPAINGLCPATLTLVNGVCCPSTTTAVECADDVSIGPCVAGGCQGNVGYLCDTAQEKCCPVVNYTDPVWQLGPAVGGLCPGGYAVVYTPEFPDGICVDIQSIPGICLQDVQVGPCSDTQTCPAGSTCFIAGQVCCPPAAFRKLKPGNKGVIRTGAARPTYGRPLHSYMPPRTMGGSMSCPDGTPAGGACMNGLCGVGHECIEGLCCLPQSNYGISQQGTQDLKSTCPTGETAVSGCFADGTCGTGYECVKHMNLCCSPGSNIPPPIPSGPSYPGQQATSVRPIGARCMQDVECVGHGEGLSMCHAGVCQCSPIAYSQGIACIRRKAMQMMMNDSPVMDTEVEKAVEKNLVAPVPTA